MTAIQGFIGVSGNTSYCDPSMKAPVEITTMDAFAQYLKDCKATASVDADQTTIIEIGKAGPDSVKTQGDVLVNGEKVQIVLYHERYNYGVHSTGEHVKINLNGQEKKILLSLFTKANLAIAFG